MTLTTSDSPLRSELSQTLRFTPVLLEGSATLSLQIRPTQAEKSSQSRENQTFSVNANPAPGRCSAVKAHEPPVSAVCPTQMLKGKQQSFKRHFRSDSGHAAAQ